MIFVERHLVGQNSQIRYPTFTVVHVHWKKHVDIQIYPLQQDSNRQYRFEMKNTFTRL